MSITVLCPVCAAKLKAPDDKRGKQSKCPRCGELVKIPADASPELGDYQHSDLPPSVLPVEMSSESGQHLEPANDFITLDCPSCGGSLALTDNTERFDCKYCGKLHLIRRQGNLITVMPVIEKLDRIVTGVDRQAAELAIVRLEKEINELSSRIAILDKQKSKQPDNIGVLLLVTAAGIFGLATLASAITDSNGLIMSLVITVVLIGFSIRSASRNAEEKKNRRAEINDRLGPIYRLLNEKTLEREQNLNLVRQR